MRKAPTLELPKYVHRVIDSGREYFYLQKGRGTKAAGPSIRLPGGPNSIEFWVAYKEHLGGILPSGKSFNDLIQACK